ncbi:MAG: polysaccharide biosynthesis protein PelF [Acidobacteriota bacterium]|jgi:glycosyltransferase involved in cell wall biosynthesis|nr:polysaccharide biosynthesis protein PelF [Acidobacteriota bacterium]
MSLSVLLTTEGTYPYSAGGVSTWCEALLRNTPDIRWTLLPLMMNPHIEQTFEPPENVRRILGVPLWGIEEPAEFIPEIPFAQLYDRKRRTTEAAIEAEFLPIFRNLLQVICGNPADAPLFGRTLVALEDYFRQYDYNQTFKSRPVWNTFRESVEHFSRNKVHASGRPSAEQQMPSIFDLTESLRWLYHFLIVLNVRVPKTSVTHATAAAFCGIPCITAKLRHGTPMVLTEHGVYLREQYLFLSRFHRLFFCKQFLLNLITAVVRACYHFADVVAPVCHYNTRWEVAHGTPPGKIRVIYNGVDPDKFQALPPAATTTGDLRVVTTARIDPLKDIETLLRVAARLKTTHPRVTFTVHGTIADDAYYRRCLALRKHLGVEASVTLGTATEDVVSAYRDADVVLLTSISEAFPYSVIEAMACEKAVVASDVGGVGEALEGCGVLVKPRDDETFAAEVRKLLDDRALRLHLGTKARARVMDEFRLDHTIGRYVDLYRGFAA